jgi:hypothetical protein
MGWSLSSDEKNKECIKTFCWESPRKLHLWTIYLISVAPNWSIGHLWNISMSTIVGQSIHFFSRSFPSLQLHLWTLTAYLNCLVSVSCFDISDSQKPYDYLNETVIYKFLLLFSLILVNAIYICRLSVYKIVILEIRTVGVLGLQIVTWLKIFKIFYFHIKGNKK